MITVSIPTDLEHELFKAQVSWKVEYFGKQGSSTWDITSSVEVILSDFYHSRDKNVFF